MHRGTHHTIHLFSLLLLCLMLGCARQSQTAGPAPIREAVTVKNEQGFPLTLRSVAQDGENIRARFCSTLPAEGDWQLGTSNADVVLSIGRLKYDSSGTGSFIFSDPQGSGRCADALFFVQGQPDLSQVKLTVKQLATRMPEAPDCDKAQAKLKSKQIDIAFKCQVSEGGFSLTILKTPDNMTMEQARDVIYNQGLIDSIPGPWIFSTGLFRSPEE